MSRRVGRILIIVTKSIKETEFFFFFFFFFVAGGGGGEVQCKIEFYFTHEHQNLYNACMNTKTCIFTRGYRHSWKYCFWCSFGEIKLDLTLKNSIILYLSVSFESRQTTALFRLISLDWSESKSKRTDDAKPHSCSVNFHLHWLGSTWMHIFWRVVYKKQTGIACRKYRFTFRKNPSSKSIAREPLLTLKLKNDHNDFSRTARAVLQWAADHTLSHGSV